MADVLLSHQTLSSMAPIVLRKAEREHDLPTEYAV